MSLKLILGSSSKFRKALLRGFGFENFETMNPDIDEKAIRHADPSTMVKMISNGKMDALINNVTEDAVIITSDQVIEVDGQVREKPESVEVCKQYLRSYSEGKPAVCHVGIVVYNTRTKERLVGSAIARQYFKPMPESFYDELIAQGDCMWCAGGFCVEQMEQYADRLEGEIECVQGLPKALTIDLLNKIGFQK